MIAIIDYDAGNIKSVEKALMYFGQDAVITRDPKVILGADKAILPGVGAFGDAMSRLAEYDLINIIRDYVATGRPFLGICLGLQLLFEESEESPGVAGLSLLKGKILRLPDKQGFKIPQIGWNSLELLNDGRLYKGVDNGAFVYFVHSYYLKAEDPGIVTAKSEYTTTVHASVESDNIFACQFHPEKSSEVGLRMIKNFIEL